MRAEFVARGVVCLAPMPSNALDIAAFEAATGLTNAQTQILNPQLALLDYGSIRVLVGPMGQVQIEVQPAASADVSERAAREIVRQARPYALRAVGFNGLAHVRAERGEDPIRLLINEELVQSRLDTQLARTGAKLVYPLAQARLTLDFAPNDDDPTLWLAAVNRHYPEPPDGEALEEAINWFAALDGEFVPLIRRLLDPDSSGARNVA